MPCARFNILDLTLQTLNAVKKTQKAVKAFPIILVREPGVCYCQSVPGVFVHGENRLTHFIMVLYAMVQV